MKNNGYRKFKQREDTETVDSVEPKRKKVMDIQTFITSSKYPTSESSVVGVW